MGKEEKINHLKNYIYNNVCKSHLNEEPSDNLKIIVIIPAYNEDKLFNTLTSLSKCDTCNCDVEVIVVLNSSENENKEVIYLHNIIREDFVEWSLKNSNSKVKYLLINIENISEKEMGVGYARKVGMDEACQRFYLSGNYDGVIVSLDADCKVSKNYLTEIEKLFTNEKIIGCNIRFEHEIENETFDKSIYDAIIQYELYLHYFVIALKYIGYPYYYHTIGSCFAVRAYIYAQEGGMNKKQGGEDFYFLQKVFPLGYYKVLKNACVYPSSRLSFRVPFGTGITLNKIIKETANKYYIYNFEAFKDLKQFIDFVWKFYQNRDYKIFSHIHSCFWDFIPENEFNLRLNEILSNTSNFDSFKKRFFRWFNAFMIIRWLNESHKKNFYFKQYVFDALNSLFNEINVNIKYDGNNHNLLNEVRNFIYEKLY